MADVCKQLLDKYGEVSGARLIEPQFGLTDQGAVGHAVQGYRADGGRGFKREEEEFAQRRFEIASTNLLMMSNLELLKQHLETNWGKSIDKKGHILDPLKKMSEGFSVLEFPPSGKHDFWIYSTLGMSTNNPANLIELHVFSNKQDSPLIELLTITASFHRNDTPLGLHHTVNFGRPWQDDSTCSFGFISLPYMDGEDLEIFNFEDGHLHNLWLMPITESERDYKIENGWDALEQRFEDCGLDYLNSERTSCV